MYPLTLPGPLLDNEAKTFVCTSELAEALICLHFNPNLILAGREALLLSCF